MEQKTSSNLVECPICSKEYHPSMIEAHASKCLFLNESSKDNQSQNFLKRQNSENGQNKGKSKNKRPNKEIDKHNDMRILKKVALEENRQESPDRSMGTEIPAKEPIVEAKKINHIPLAERMRPSSLLGYVGQSHIMGKSSMLLQLLGKGEIPNMILWGPPGCGKTSLANVIANICKRSPNGKLRYVKISAAMSGVADVKESVRIASNELKFGRRTIMFMDEIHRFNKSQQDIFLPHIESGTITLIGATTENPSFSLNSALLSRCRVIVLEKLSAANIVDILTRSVDFLDGKIYVSKDSTNAPGTSKISATSDSPYVDLRRINELEIVPRFLIDLGTIEWLGETCDGDARIALSGLELAVQTLVPNDEEFTIKGPASISLEDVRESLKKSHMLYDRRGDEHYDIISALHKSVRASDENASLYWLTRMMAGGEDPLYIARRLVRMACEDIGLKDPNALRVAVDTMHGCKMLGMPESDVLLAHCATYLARAPKSRLIEDALRSAQRLVANQRGPQPPVPLHLKNAPTRLMANLGYGRGYNMLHKDESGLNYLPEGLENIDFFEDSNKQAM